MLNFTVGPVMSPSEVLEVSAKSAPYFRTPEFSQVMQENERIMLDLLSAPKDSRCVFLTASGTGAMEAAVMSVLAPAERVAVVNGGSFGQRFVDLCQLHGHTVDEIKLEFGHQIARKNLEDAVDLSCGALLVNMHETSSGLLYDMSLLSDFCREREMLLIVDAVSAFIAEEIDMAALGADVVLTGSQKALACHPGISLMALSPRGQERVAENPEVCSYLSLKEALRNGERGQTPWTPAVNTLLEINARLRSIGAHWCHHRGGQRQAYRLPDLAIGRGSVLGGGADETDKGHRRRGLPAHAAIGARHARGVRPRVPRSRDCVHNLRRDAPWRSAPQGLYPLG